MTVVTLTGTELGFQCALFPNSAAEVALAVAGYPSERRARFGFVTPVLAFLYGLCFGEALVWPWKQSW